MLLTNIFKEGMWKTSKRLLGKTFLGRDVYQATTEPNNNRNNNSE